MDGLFYFPFYQEHFDLDPGVSGFDDAFLKFSITSPRAFGKAQIQEAAGKAVQVRWYDLSQSQIANCTNLCTLTPGMYYLRITPAQGHSPQGYYITASISALPADTFVYGSSDVNSPLPIGSILSPGQSGSFSGVLYGVLERGAPVAGYATLPTSHIYSTDYRTQFFSINTSGGVVRLSISGQARSVLYRAKFPIAAWATVPANGIVWDYAQPLTLWLTTETTSDTVGTGTTSDFYERFTLGFQALSSGNAPATGPSIAPQPNQPYSGPVYCVLPPWQQQNCPPGTIH
ncbi:MAG TPA: hypothetical protein VG166_03830 [Caulobacteraceae bacterium]|nr:hypothetical protein [Caulobacteraceae bacterium]